MRHYYTSGLSFVSAMYFLFILTSAYSQTNGLYYHKPGDKYLMIEEAKNGLMAKTKNENKWTFYQRRRNGEYFDRRGNRIEIWNQSKIVFVPVRSHRGKVYFLMNYQNPVRSPVYNTPQGEDNQRIEGLWFNNELNIHLIVVETREGIKVRLKDEKKWVKYDWQQSDQSFISEEGNYYYLKENQLIYRHHDRMNTLEFSKKSDSFDGY